MRTGRLEAFSDGVIAILITVMVLELHTPKHPTWEALGEILPVLLAYVLSFVYLGIYWNNHHHLLASVSRVSGSVLWANLHLLFWLSLVPFGTAWMSEYDFAVVPTAAYGIVLLLAAIAYWILQGTLLRAQGSDARLAAAIGRNLKGRISAALCFAGILLTFVNHWIGLALYVIVAVIWFVPDRRLERLLVGAEGPRVEPVDGERTLP